MGLKIRFTLLLFAFCFAFSLTTELQAQSGTWAVSAGSGLRDYVSDVITDASGNSYITGYFTDSIEFESTKFISHGKNDIYVAKYDPDGNLLWAQQHGWHASEFSKKLAFNWDGDLVIAGDYQDSTIIGGDTLFSLDTLWFGPAAETYDVFFLTLDPNGTQKDIFADGWFSSERVYDFEFDGNANNVMACTWHTYSWWESGEHGKGFHDAMLISLDSSAQLGEFNVHLKFKNRSHAWGKFFDEAREVEVIGDSLYVLAGTFQDTCYFRDSTVFSITDLENDIYITAHDDTAAYRWHIAGGSPGKDRLTGMDQDASGNLYFSGIFDSLFSIQGMDAVGAGSLDGFLGKVDQNGNMQWIQAIGGTGFDGIEDVKVRPSGDLVVTGYFQGEMTLGGQTVYATDSLDQNLFVASFLSDGSVNWVWSGGGSAIDLGTALSISANDEIFVTGTFGATAYFGQQVLVSNGSDDVFLMRMAADGSVSSQSETLLPGAASLKTTVFPNPSQGQVNVFYQLLKAEKVQVRVMDLQGRVLLQQLEGKKQAGDQQLSLGLDHLQNGIYFIQVIAGQSQSTHKLVINR